MQNRRVAHVFAVLAIAATLTVGCSSTSTDPTSSATTELSDSDTAVAATGSAALLAAACAGSLTVADGGTVTAPDITEASGIAASRRNPGVWWVHNDSGDTARFFAVSATGELLATEVLDGATAIDWEDIAVGPPAGEGAGVQSVYLADIGDNSRTHTESHIYRVVEPAVDATSRATTGHVTGDTLTFTYPDGPHDAEDFMVDPVSGDLIIVTKDWSLAGHSEVYRAPPGLAAGSTTVLEHVDTVELRIGALTTGGDVSSDGHVVALRSYKEVSLYPRPDGQPVWAAFAQKPCAGAWRDEKQGEAIGFAADGSSYATISEGSQPGLHLVGPS